MSGGVAAGIAGAVLLFWAVGAYNRLVRLRSQALQSFGALAVQLRRRHALAEGVDAPGSDPAQRFPAVPAAAGGLFAAAQQFGASIAAAQARPLGLRNMGSLGAANAVLAMAWQRHVANGGTAIDAALQVEWQSISVQLAHAGAEFDEAIERYNAALKQFPAWIVAAVFGLRRAGKLEQ